MTTTANVPQLRFPEFSGEWVEKKLEDFVDYVKGFAFKSDDYRDSGIRIVRVSDLASSSIKENGEKVFIDSNLLVNFNKYLINRGDIIITTVGSKPELIESAVGRGILVKNNNEGLLNQNLLKINNSNSYSNIFIFGYINSHKYTNHIKNIQRGNANQSNIALTDLFEYVVYFPSLPEQTKIASFLSVVDTKIDQLTQKKALLETYKKGAMQQVFSQQIRFTADDGGEYPEWEEKKLGDFLSLTLRETPTPKENYLALGVRSHCKGTFQKPDSDPDKISMDKLYKVEEDDLVVSITFAWEGAIAIVNKSDDGALVSHRFPTYVFKNQIATHKFFNYVITQKRFRLMLDLISPGGAGRNRVMSKKDFINLFWLMPSLEEQTKIANFLSAIDRKIDLVSQQLEQTKAFKKGLLQQMFV